MLTHRRQFLCDAALGVAALAASRSESVVYANPLDLPVGLQLYTVRDRLAKDFEGTLKEVAAIGYDEVEQDAKQKASVVREALRAAGLHQPSAHFDLKQLESALDKQIQYAKELQLDYMVCSYFEPHNSLDDFKRVADTFNRVGEESHKVGVQLCYHNHNFEFRDFGGVVGYDELLRRTDPALVKMQIDCYWMQRAGKDPVLYFQQNPGRVPLLHIKDMKPGHAPTSDTKKGGDAFTEVGRGVIDWKRIFQAAPVGGVRHYFVEQDTCERPTIESARISYQYLHGLRV